MSVYEPYVPANRLMAILEDYMDRWGLTQQEIARELAAHHGTEDGWIRRLYSWRSGETGSVRFPIADQVLTALDLSDLWYTTLNDIYEAA